MNLPGASGLTVFVASRLVAGCTNGKRATPLADMAFVVGLFFSAIGRDCHYPDTSPKGIAIFGPVDLLIGDFCAQIEGSAILSPGAFLFEPLVADGLIVCVFEELPCKFLVISPVL